MRVFSANRIIIIGLVLHAVYGYYNIFSLWNSIGLTVLCNLHAGGLLGGGGYAYLSLSKFNDFIPGKMQHQRYSILYCRVNKQFVPYEGN